MIQYFAYDTIGHIMGSSSMNILTPTNNFKSIHISIPYPNREIVFPEPIRQSVFIDVISNNASLLEISFILIFQDGKKWEISRIVATQGEAKLISHFDWLISNLTYSAKEGSLFWPTHFGDGQGQDNGDFDKFWIRTFEFLEFGIKILIGDPGKIRGSLENHEYSEIFRLYNDDINKAFRSAFKRISNLYLDMPNDKLLKELHIIFDDELMSDSFSVIIEKLGKFQSWRQVLFSYLEHELNRRLRTR